jgi:hypothetical protein
LSESSATDDDLTGEPHAVPPGEHDSDLPDGSDNPDPATQEENAETSLDQPSQ